MKVYQQMMYEGWRIATICRPRVENGRTVEGCACRVGFQLTNPTVYPAGWKEKRACSIPERGFRPFEVPDVAHRTLIADAIAVIDSFKW